MPIFRRSTWIKSVRYTSAHFSRVQTTRDAVFRKRWQERRRLSSQTNRRCNTPANRACGKQTREAPYSIGTHHYFDRVVGNCHFFFIDTRGERTKFNGVAHSGDADRHVLGDVQKKWFLDELTCNRRGIRLCRFAGPMVHLPQQLSHER